MKRKQKITEFFFNEHDGTAEVYTHNTDLKKRLSQYAQTYPHLCQLTEEDENGGLRFEIDKRRISIRLTAPCTAIVSGLLFVCCNPCSVA